MCVCVCIYIYIYTHAHVHNCQQKTNVLFMKRIFAIHILSLCMYVCMHVCMFVYMHTHTCLYLSICVCMHVCVYIHTYVYVYVPNYGGMHVIMHIWRKKTQTHTNAYIHPHSYTQQFSFHRQYICLKKKSRHEKIHTSRERQMLTSCPMSRAWWAKFSPSFLLLLIRDPVPHGSQPTELWTLRCLPHAWLRPLQYLCQG
jgi:hypothetical protein